MLLETLQRRSSFEPSGLKRNMALALNRTFSPPTDAIEGIRSDAAIDPAIESISQVRWAEVGVARSPAGKEHRLLIRHAVAICIAQEERIRHGEHERAIFPGQDTARDAQAGREDGDLVKVAVALRAFPDADAVAARALLLQVVRESPASRRSTSARAHRT